MTGAAELVRLVLAEHIGRADTQFTVDANPGERAAVAERLMIPAIDALRCVWALRPGMGGMIQATGTLQAKVTQLCVITLDPFDTSVDEQFDVHFVLAGREGADDDPDAPDELVYDGTTLDLGEATVEQLALALDPYPRKPGAILPPLDDEPEVAGFAALAKLRRLD